MQRLLVTSTFALLFMYNAHAQETRKQKKEKQLGRAEYNIFSKEVKPDSVEFKKNKTLNRYKSQDTEDWYKFEIPQVINGSNISPTAADFISSEFTDSKLSAQVGFPRDTAKQFLFTGSIGAEIAATDGISILAKTDNSPVEFGFKGGISRIFKHKILCIGPTGNPSEYSPRDQKIDHTKSAETVVWMTLFVKWNRHAYNLFDSLSTFDNMLVKDKTSTGQLVLAINKYKYAKFSLDYIWSIGVGYARTNNYEFLPSRVLHEVMQPAQTNPTGTRIREIVKTTSGAVGRLEEYEGLAMYFEGYIPLQRSLDWGNIFVGGRATHYLAADQWNGNVGVFVNIKSGEREDKDKKKGNSAPDKLNFSISGQFDKIQLNKKEEETGERRFFDATSSLVLQVAIPLTFLRD